MARSNLRTSLTTVMGAPGLSAHRARQRLYGAKALHTAVKAMNEQLGGSLVCREGGEVFDRLVHNGVGVVFQAAVAACPSSVV